jgi:hypothetical protein
VVSLGCSDVAISQAFVYASLAAAPLIVVTPILQLSLIFRLGLSQWINREHEVIKHGSQVDRLRAGVTKIVST